MSAILELRDIVKLYGRGHRAFAAVDHVNLSIQPGSSFGLVGESGSGKSTLARCALRLVAPTSGSSIFEGQDLAGLRGRSLWDARKGIGMVFQNPVSALNPRLTIGRLVAEPLLTHTRIRGQELRDRVEVLLMDVGLAPDFARRLPHQLSGGQCQRVGIARALAMSPRLLVLDEPTSALDVSVQAQILNLLRDIRESRQLTYLLISHDLSVVRYMCDEVAVMYRGRVVEQGESDAVFEGPVEEYTRTLLAASRGIGKTDD
jgi:ABC-type oligopeptide transport system ATPase subunit